MVTNSLRARWRFFAYEHGTGISGRNALSAWDLAKAEEHFAEWEWDSDSDPDISDAVVLRFRFEPDPEYNPDDYDYPLEPNAAGVVLGWGAILERWNGTEWERAESVWAVTFGGDGYPETGWGGSLTGYARFLRAELVSEFLARQ